MLEVHIDDGPIYCETVLGRFPVEPFNTVSNLLFLAVAIYWFLKKPTITNKDLRRYLDFAIPLLVIGYVGGTIYHATRSHVIWMLMDVTPIYFLAVMSAVYFWRLLGMSGLKIALSILVIVGVPNLFLWTVFKNHSQRHTLGYITLVTPVLLPILIDQVRMGGKYFGAFLIPLIMVSLALFFRTIDSFEFVKAHFAFGTHFLWHIFGALTCHYLVAYMYKRSPMDEVPIPR